MARIYFLVLLTLLFQGCAGSRGELTRIDADRVIARQNMVEEMTYLLREQGYDWIPLVDPANRAAVKVVEQKGQFGNKEYMMRFEYLQTRQVRIDVHIRWEDGMTRLYLYEPGSTTLSASSVELLKKLRQRVELQFGKASVSY